MCPLNFSQKLSKVSPVAVSITARCFGAAGSLAWGGIRTTFYWIDPKRGIGAVIMMQFLPFCDDAAMGMMGDFERSVYSHLT